jgi:hypothetical protein
MPGISFPFTGRTLSSAKIAKRAEAKRRTSKAAKTEVPKKKKPSKVKKAVKALAQAQSASPGGASLFQNVRALVRAFNRDDEE